MRPPINPNRFDPIPALPSLSPGAGARFVATHHGAARKSEQDRALDLVTKVRGSIWVLCAMVGFSPAGAQRDFLARVEQLSLNHALGPKRFGAKAGTGTGKSAMLALAMLWRLLRWPGTFGINTAPSERQCKEIFFAELSRWVSRSPVLSNMLEVKRSTAHFKEYRRWQIYAATASNENAVRGAHHAHLTVGAEELTGIDRPIADAFLRTLSEQDNLFMAVFNPDEAQGLALEMFTTKREFWPFNLTIDKLSISKERPDLISPARIEEWRREHGESSDFWQIGVLGNFPVGGSKQVIPSGVYDRTKGQILELVIAMSAAVRVISHDPARFGGDDNSLAARSGNAIVRLESQQCEPNDMARRALELRDELGWGDETIFVVDRVGVGQGVLQTYIDAGVQLVEFCSSDPSPVAGYRNVLSAGFWNLRLKMKHEHVFMPDDEILEYQITSRRFTYRASMIEVEDKDTYIKREKKSPDRADAVVMAFSIDSDVQQTVTEDLEGFVHNSQAGDRPYGEDSMEDILAAFETMY